MKTKYDNVFVNPTPDEIKGHNVAIAFDLDSVLNEGDYLRRFIACHFGTTMSAIIGHQRPDGYEVFNFDIPGVPDKEIGVAVRHCILQESPSALPSPHMRGVLDYVYDITNQPIAIVTARYGGAVGVTKRWLEEHISVPFICYICDGVPKAPVLSYLGAKMFIDDRHKTIKDLINWIPYPIMFKRPWNQGRPTKLPVVEINDLRDIIPMLNVNYGRTPLEWPGWLPFPTPEGERKIDATIFERSF